MQQSLHVNSINILFEVEIMHEKVQHARGDAQASQLILEHALKESLTWASSRGNPESTNVFGGYFFADVTGR
jgi:hypothetical protein